MVWYGRQDPGVRFGGFYSLLEKASCASPVLAAIALRIIRITQCCYNIGWQRTFRLPRVDEVTQGQASKPRSVSKPPFLTSEVLFYVMVVVSVCPLGVWREGGSGDFVSLFAANYSTGWSMVWLSASLDY